MNSLKVKVGLATIIISMFLCTPAMAAKRETDITTPKDGYMLVEVEGTFSTATKQQVLNRINQIRKEACDKGFVNPSTDEKLTSRDYIPIKWSSDLEWIAQTRAAEASVNEAHSRPNGKSCFTLSHNGVYSWAENLAWNYGGMMDAIEQWYDEKEDWVKQNPNAVTGHYTSLINPEYLYIGLGTFQREDNWITTAGEFSDEKNLDEQKSGVTGKYEQVIEVQDSDVKLSLGKTSVVKGDTKQLRLKVEIRGMSAFGSGVSIPGYVTRDIIWTSSEPSIISVDAQGKITGCNYGNAVITAKVQGKTASAQMSCVKKVTVAKGKTPKLKNLKGKKLKITYKAITGAKGYQIQYARNSKFTKGKKTITLKGRTKTVKVKKGIKYYVRVRAYKIDVNNKKVYGAWSNKKSLKIKK